MPPRIVVMHGIKYEPQWLVDDLHENLSWVDDFAVVDCRSRTDELWIDERDLYARQRKKAEQLGADWVLVTAPDERWDIGAEQEIRKAIEGPRDRSYRFPVLELHEPTKYRVDGDWGRRTQSRLFPLIPDAIYDNKLLHNSIIPKHPRLKPKLLSSPCYHLKHIEPENRWVRRKVFETLDPQNKFQRIGYEYLDDEANMELRDIPQGLGFAPPYTRKYIFAPPKELYDL